MGLFITYRMRRPNGEDLETGIVNISAHPLTKPEDVAQVLALNAIHFEVHGTLPTVSWALVHGNPVDALIESARLL